jgi:Zn-dependent protease
MTLILDLIVLLFSVILHEIAHGFVAERLGDPTARLMGRLTLNPRSHIDPFMSIALPLILVLSGSPIVFGAAKPVPVDPFNLKEGRKDLALVSLAGPLTNILLAIFASFVIKLLALPFVQFSLPQIATALLQYIFDTILTLNLYLAIFNLLPIPPLDGSKILALFLPEEQANNYLALGNLGMIIFLFLLMVPIGGFSLNDFIFNIYTFAHSLLLP